MYDRYDLKNHVCFIDKGVLHLFSAENKVCDFNADTHQFEVSATVEGKFFNGQGKNRSEAERVFVEAVKYYFRRD